MTVTPYGREIEPGVPDKTKVLNSFRRLSLIVGADSVGWRYDPIMTVPMYEQAIRCRLKTPKKTPARKQCACFLGGDIGAYNTCGHLCRYCYANYDAETVGRNMRLHDPSSPLLIGRLMPGDRVHDAKQESWKDGQVTLL